MPPSTEGEENVPPLVREALERYLAVQPEKITRLERLVIAVLQTMKWTGGEPFAVRAMETVLFARLIESEMDKQAAKK